MIQTLRRRWGDFALLLLATVAVVLVIVTSRSVTTGEVESRADHLLVAFRAGELTRVVLEQGTGRVVLEREPPVAPSDAAADSFPGDPDELATPSPTGVTPGDWRLREPALGELDPVAVEALVDALERAVLVRRLDPEAGDRSRFGLDAPRAVVSLEMGPLRYRILLGGEAAAPAGAAYVEIGGVGVPGRGVGVVRSETVAALKTTLDELRVARLLPYAASELERVELRHADAELELVRRDGRWYLVLTEGSRLADPALADLLLAQLVSLEAEVPVALEGIRARSSAEQLTRVQLSPTGGRPTVRLELGGDCPVGEGMVAVRVEPEPRAGCVQRATRSILELPFDRWESRRLFGLGPDAVETLRIERGSERLELVRSGTGYRLREPRSVPIDTEAGNRRLLALLEARGERIPTPDVAQLGLEPPVATVTLTSAAATEADVRTEVVEVGLADAEGRAHVRRRLDQVVLRVDRQVVRALLPDATLLRPRALFDDPPAAVRRVESEGAVEQTLLQSRSGAFELARPDGYAVDAGLASDLVETLARLEAERWVADRDDGSFGLAPPAQRLRFTVEVAPGRLLERELMLGHRTAGGVYAAVAGEPGVFVLARGDAVRCQRLLLDRTLWPPESASVLGVEVETVTARLVLARLGEGFEQIAGDPRLPTASLQRLGEALRDLRAEAALRLGPARPEEGFAQPQLVLRLRLAGGEASSRTIRFGAADSREGLSVVLARVDGLEATFAVPRSQVAAILDPT